LFITGWSEGKAKLKVGRLCAAGSKFNQGTISAPPFGKGRWLRLGEDGGIDDAGSNAWPRFQTQSQKLILSTISAPPFSKGRNKAMH